MTKKKDPEADAKLRAYFAKKHHDAEIDKLNLAIASARPVAPPTVYGRSTLPPNAASSGGKYLSSFNSPDPDKIVK